MTPHVSTIGTRHRKEPITPEQRQQIEARFAELQRERPLTGAYARLRKGGITCAVVHGWVGNRAHARRLHGHYGAKVIRESPVLSALRDARLKVAHAVKAQRYRERCAALLAAGLPLPRDRRRTAGDSMRPKAPLPSSSLNTIDVEDTTTLAGDRLRLAITQRKCETALEKNPEKLPKKRGRPKKVVQELPKEVSRLTNQTKFAKTNKAVTW